MTHYNNANAARQNWYFTAQKLKKARNKTGGEGSGNKKAGGEAGGKKRGKRQAVDPAAAPVAKRGRLGEDKNDEEDQPSGAEADDDGAEV
jgi:hypothetical protein